MWDNAVKSCINFSHSHSGRPTHGNRFSNTRSDTRSPSLPVERDHPSPGLFLASSFCLPFSAFLLYHIQATELILIRFPSP